MYSKAQRWHLRVGNGVGGVHGLCKYTSGGSPSISIIYRSIPRTQLDEAAVDLLTQGSGSVGALTSHDQGASVSGIPFKSHTRVRVLNTIGSFDYPNEMYIGTHCSDKRTICHSRNHALFNLFIPAHDVR